MSECTGRMLQFRFGRLKFARFEDCDLRDSDFQGTDLSGVIFSDCDLRNAEFSQTTLVGTDLTTSRIDGIRVNQESVKGLIVEPQQAAHLAALFGVDVRWS